MSGKELESADETLAEIPGGEEEEPYPTSPASMPLYDYAPSESWSDVQAYIAPMKMSALSYITCPLCQTMYIKGDDHACP